MCTYRINIDDNKASVLQTRFESERAVELWIEQQIDLLLAQHLAVDNAGKKKCEPKVYQHDMLCGMLSTGASFDELRDEYVSEKYGV